MNGISNAVSAFSMYKKKDIHLGINKAQKRIRKAKKSTNSIQGQPEDKINSNIKTHTPVKSPAENSLDHSLMLNINPIEKKKPKVSKTSRKSISKSSNVESQKVNFFDKPQLTFEWLIAPIEPSDFFNTWWEKSPVLLNRNDTDPQELFTTEILDHIIRTNSLFYTQNVDVVSYEDGKRATHNPEGLVYPAVLWDFYNNKCSIRILNPHTYSKKLHTLVASLQEYFGCMVGINAYLTPSGSQGFAPHYDDIEAFVLQLEGRKHWKLYAPLTQAEILPRYSSKNFDRNELKEPLKELTLQAGDLLYFPRGVIHEGYTDSDSHSLHITISVYQKTAYIDLLEHAIKSALNTAVNLNSEYRQGLPRQYLQHTGVVNSHVKSSTREEIIGNVKQLITKLTEYVDVDSAADQLGKQFMWDAMPPVPSSSEKSCMIHENSERIKNGVVYNNVSITLDIKVRLLSYHCLRVVTEANTVSVYYTTENAKYYHGLEQQSLEIDLELIPGLKFLIHKYPAYVKVEKIPIANELSRMQLVSDLWERGLIVTETPLENLQ